jgi:hypothetical protein
MLQFFTLCRTVPTRALLRNRVNLTLVLTLLVIFRTASIIIDHDTSIVSAIVIFLFLVGIRDALHLSCRCCDMMRCVKHFVEKNYNFI